ncbi:hypothetical protein ACJMK2_009933 [Sinanodonta woodiana]|uniref:TAR DNA-binding protein 43 n=1 Tax=Sinanodonta woodiana TaxID=1069815 RepID=A0ABD3VGV6_SINWO
MTCIKIENMSQYIQVTDDESEEPIEIPSEEDGTLLLSTLAAQFPTACGLKYRNPQTGNYRGIRLTDGNLHPPESHWGSHVYIVVFPKDNKRKGDEVTENISAKTKRVDQQKKCSDLIVLGLPWKSTEDDLRNYFSQFGELVLSQVKRDPKTGLSKGYGFIRFNKYDDQMRCMSQRHNIDGRWCDVTIPNSNEGAQHLVSRKVFIARCTEDIKSEDLKAYFSRFGEVVDVFIPKPFRSFAFVSFADPEVAQSLCGEDHIIKGVSVHVSYAAPKGTDRHGEKKVQMPSKGIYQQGGPPGWNPQHGQGNPGGKPGNMPEMNSLGMNFFNSAMLAAAQAVLQQQGWAPGGTPGAPPQGSSGDNAHHAASQPGSYSTSQGSASNWGWGQQSDSTAGGYQGWGGGATRQGGWN